MSSYRGDRPLDYDLILKRLEELKLQNRNGYTAGLVKELKRKGEWTPPIYWDELTDDTIQYLESMLDDGLKRKRLVVDSRNGIFKIIEDKRRNSGGGLKMPRPRFA